MRKRAVLTTLLVVTLVPCVFAEQPVLVVYDFTSAFDGGKMGEWVTEVVRGHAQRSGRYVGNPKITVDEILARENFHPTAATTPEDLALFTREKFDAGLFVYGSVEQAGLGCRVRFRVYRTSAGGKPEKVLDETRDCPDKQFVPLAVDEVLNAAAGVKDWPTEWKLFAEELKAWSGELAASAEEEKTQAVDWRAKSLASEEKLTERRRNVTARTHVDFANKALLEYAEEVLDGQRELLAELTGGTVAEARAKARRLSRLSECLSLSIVHWLDGDSAEKRWKEGKNLVMNGDFEVGQKTPANWEPLKEHMSWVEDPDGPSPAVPTRRDGPGGKSHRCVKFDMPEDIAGSYGMLLYSQPFSVDVGATYRLRWRFKTLAPAVKLFVKGYDEFPKEAGFEAQDREVWRSRKDPQFGPRVPKNDYKLGEWTEYGHDFVPFVTGKTDPATGRLVRSPKQPRFVKLMLYAYWPKGIVYWDDIVVKKIKDAPLRPKAGE
jgi:hypothetical protein